MQLVQCTCNSGDKLKFTEVVLFQNFLLTRITTGRADYQNKKKTMSSKEK